MMKLIAKRMGKRMKRNLLTITVVEDAFYFDIVCVDVDDVINVEFRLNYMVEKNNNSVSKQLELMAKTIRKDLLHKEYLKYPVLVSLNLGGVFVERMELPRLSRKEMRRAIALELAKLYGDYESKFVYSILLSQANKQLYNLRVALYNRENYRQILSFLQETRLKIEKITLAQDNFKNLILNKNLLGRPDIANLIINVGKRFTTILGIKDTSVIAHHIVHHGFKIFRPSFEDLLQEWDDDALPAPLKRELRKELAPIMKEVYRITGGLVREGEVETYLYVEDEIEDKLLKAMVLNYDMRINKLSVHPYLKELLEISVLEKGDQKQDFVFPARLE
ncbi:MAG: hypothetical protein WBH29_04550 [Bacilli bacterium]